VKQEDHKTLTIQAATEKVIVPREEIEERSVSKVSFMPAGILEALSDEEVRDLIGYLQSPDQVPLPPEQPKPAEQPKPPHEPWLTGTTDEKFSKVERQLRGLDVAMAEIGYRYGELITASQTRNWDYAQYQAEKIDLSLQLALERRPKRAKSSQPFLKEDLPAVLAAIKQKDGEQLDRAMVRLHDSCVQCHKAENVLYFKEAVERIKDRAARP
jgi:hypothetical protein